MVLLPTFGIQTYRQWQQKDDPAPWSAVWFFVLALIGTGGQVAYSAMVGNTVYLVLNICLVFTNSIGLWIAYHRPRPGENLGRAHNSQRT